MNRQTFSLSHWTKATFLGWFVGIILIIVLSSTLDSVGVEGVQFYLGVGLGAGIGFFQWRVLKEITGVNLSWLWSSLLGLGVPFLLFDLVSMYSAQPLGSKYLPLSVGTSAVFIAVLQYFILKKFSPAAHLWIIGSIAGWILAASAVLCIDYIKLIIHHNLALFIINLIMILGGGVVLGLITGLSIKKILGTK